MNISLDTGQITRIIVELRRAIATAIPRMPHVCWSHHVSPASYYPFTYYMTALRGSPDGDELLVVAVECNAAQNDGGEQLVMRAGITRDAGLLVSQSPAIIVRVSSQSVEPPNVICCTEEVLREMGDAAGEIADWIRTQRSVIEDVLTV